MPRHAGRSRDGGLSRAARGVLVLLLALAGIIGGAPSASAAEIDCTPMGDLACRSLTPTVQCVWANPDGTRTVVFGYTNTTSDTLRIYPGNKNYLMPGPDDQGQPQQFQPGTHENVVALTFATTSGSWRLGNITASWDSTTAACASKPVSMIGNVAVLGLFLVFLAATLPVSVRSRTRVPALVRARAAR